MFVPFTDVNTGKQYSSFSKLVLQAGVTHTFKLFFQDIYGNTLEQVIILNPPYDLELRDQSGKLLAQNTSYFDHNIN